MTQFMKMVDEVITEEREIIDELLKEEVEPLIKYRQQLENRLFEKFYKQVKELEEEE